ncbi:hypothetical protein BC833DRAFT_586082 [Globomyces pollinis-pini]|nr:hypothetical protein BC833DRAFT_586082 [Globomyces pollinis-pini]
MAHIECLFNKRHNVILLSHLTQEQLNSMALQDLHSNVVYVSVDALKYLADILGNSQIGALAKLTVDSVVRGTAEQHLTAIENLDYTSKTDEAVLTLTVSNYSVEKSSLKRNAPSDSQDKQDPLKSAKSRNKRLSIDTRFSEKLENNSAVLDQMKSSYILKQQQQAIIDSRTRLSAHPDSSQSINSSSRVSGRKSISREMPPMSSLDQIASPRAEFSTRELPRPRPYDSHQNLGSQQSHSAHPLSGPKRIPSPLSNQPTIGQRSNFLNVFEQLYDSQETTNRLHLQLKEQIRKSATLLYTLSSSGQMIEGLVRSHFRDLQSQYGEKFGSALTDLNRRLVAVENRTFGSSQSDAFTSNGALKSSIPKEDGQAPSFASIADRLESIERANNTIS